MPIAVELYLDPAADTSVREIWSALDDSGVASLGSREEANYCPHVSLAVCEDGIAYQVASLARGVAEQALGLPLTLAALGFFLTVEAPAFLAVVPTVGLLQFHHDLMTQVLPAMRQPWPYYAPDALFPHCTLAMRVADRPLVIEIVEQFRLPIGATVSSVNLVEIGTGRTLDTLASK